MATEMTLLPVNVVAADECDCHRILPRHKTCDGPPQVKDWGLTDPVYTQAVEMVMACVCEAGYAIRRRWHSSLGVWGYDGAAPHDIVIKARALVADALGVQWRT